MKKYVIVGAGGRSTMFQQAIVEDFKSNAKLLAICDSNSGRLEITKMNLGESGRELAAYSHLEFDLMISEQKPDVVIVCTKDSTHDEYICRALELGCDVITEKPMTINEKKCQRIINTVRKTNKNVRVTFNYRYSPPRSQVKELLMDGVIGKVLSVEFKWMLDTQHGADYFRRWHRNKKNSGGLLVHKSTHHFDLVNWWLSDIPESVFCKGDRLFYNELQAEKYGLENHGTRCYDCSVKDKCNFYLDITAHKSMKELYYDCEEYDGYIRDKCVFSNEIDIEDSMNVVVRYKRGTLLCYSLNAFSPWEGYHIVFNGTKGRLEHLCQESSYISGDSSIQGELKPDGTWIRVYPHFGTPYEVAINQGEGSHGGGDDLMLSDIFYKQTFDPLMRAADYVQGAYSILVGSAANISMNENRDVLISELINGLPEPTFPDMPSDEEKIEFIKDFKRTYNGIVVEDSSMSISAPE